MKILKVLLVACLVFMAIGLGFAIAMAFYGTPHFGKACLLDACFAIGGICLMIEEFVNRCDFRP